MSVLILKFKDENGDEKVVEMDATGSRSDGILSVIWSMSMVGFLANTHDSNAKAAGLA
jgi:hypothetical protein